MAAEKNNDNKLRRMLRMTIFVDKSFAPIFTVRFSLVGLFVSLFMLVLLLIAGVTVLIAFTGLREFIPGYPTGEERLMIMQNMRRADSLVAEMNMRDNMMQNMRAVLKDELPASAWKRDSTNKLTTQTLANLNKAKSDEEEKFVSYVEAVEKYEVDAQNNRSVVMDAEIEATFFFTPLRGVITDNFGIRNSHYGVDVVAEEGTPVMSMLDGTVIFAEWTVQTGNVVMVLHDNNVVSVYKHNSKLLKREGDRVRAGEAISILGDSGELSSGPHLHFEMWYKGAPLDPKNYINFEPDKSMPAK